MRRCTLCGESGHNRADCSRSTGRRRKTFDPWSDLSYEEHTDAQRIVAENPDGLTLEEVGNILGITRERVRQIEVNALAKVRDSLPFDEFSIADVAYELAECEECGTLYLLDGSGLQTCEACRPKMVALTIEIEPEPESEPEPFVIPWAWAFI